MRPGTVLSVLLLLSFISPAIAQEEGDTLQIKEIIKEKAKVPKATIKINIPCLLIDLKRALFVSTDTRLNNFLSVDMGAGFYFDSWVYNEFRNENIRGIRARLGLKYYYTLGSRITPFVGFEGMINRYSIKHYETVCRYGCQYQEVMLIKTNTQAEGISARTGFQIYMGKEKRSFFEFYGGLGLKVVDRNEDLPADSGFFGFGNDIVGLNPIPDERSSGHYFGPNLILGAYFGYSFR